MSHGPFVLNNGEVILLAFVIQPVGSGFSKISDCLTALQEGVNNFQKNKNLAKIDRSKPNKMNNTDIPSEFLLSANYPNPFNPLTQIEFNLPEKAQVKLEIFNSLGQKIKTLVNDQWLNAGTHTVDWDATDENNHRVASGVYFYRLTGEKFHKQKKMLFIR